MIEAQALPQIRRILVAVDASPHSLAALETAAELAGKLEAELLGLFVEDINLVRVTGLALTREVASFSATIRKLDGLQLERQLKAQAASIRHAMELAASRAKVPWSFRAVRGVVASAVVGAASEADLILLGRSGRSSQHWRRVGSTAQAVISQGRSLTLIVEQGRLLQAPVTLIYDGSRLALKAVNLATSLAEFKSKMLSTLILADDVKSAEEHRAELQNLSELDDLSMSYQVVLRPTLGRLIQTVQMASEGPLVVPCVEPLFQGDALHKVVRELRNPILLVR
jgi:nucleotide-binding universal stress UspA family protein